MQVGFDDGAYRDMVALARHTTWLNGAISWWSDYGLLLFLVLAAAGFWRTRSLSRTLWVPVAMVPAVALNSLLKIALGEQRPCRVLPVGHIAVACPPLGDYAFPSNHAVLAGAAAMAVWALDRRLGVVAAVNAVVIAVARVYIGVHYPHDVIAGLLVGALVAWLCGRPGRWALGFVESRLRGAAAAGVREDASSGDPAATDAPAAGSETHVAGGQGPG